MISQEAIDSGIIKLNRMDIEGFKEVKAYNKHAMNCRYKSNHLKEAKYGFRILNPLVILTLCLTIRASVFHDVKSALIILLVQAVSYIVMIVKNRYMIHTICSALLIFLDIRFAILFIANLIIGGIVVFVEKRLKTKPGYPEFLKIYIVYDDTVYADNNNIQDEYIYNDVWNNRND